MKKLFAITLLFCLMTTISWAQNWETFGGNSLRSGLSKITGPQDVISPYWSTPAAATTLGNAVYTFGDQFITSRVIFSPYTGVVECRNLQSGSLIWTSPFISPTAILYAIGYNEDGVYAHDYNTDTIYALNPADGSIKWRSQVKSQTFGAYPGCVFACNGDLIVNGTALNGKFTMRLDKNTGDTLWTNSVLIAIGPAVGLAASSSTVYRITGGITIPILLTAIDINTGITKYNSLPIPGDPDQENPITIGFDNQIYFWRDGGNLFSYIDNGSALVQDWTYTPQSFTGAAFYGDISIGNDNNLYIFDTGRLRRIDYLTGTELDSSIVPIDQGAVSIGADSTVYVNDNYGMYYALTHDLQNIKWQLNIPGNTYCNMALAKDGVMVLTGSGNIISAFRPAQNLPPVADFRVSAKIVTTGQPVNFFDQSSYVSTGWVWSFPGSASITSFDQNPDSVIYNNPGMYEVMLTVQNSFGSDSVIKYCYIEVIHPSGLYEFLSGEHLSVFPNPASESISINTISALTNAPFTVTDISGKIIADGILSGTETKLNIENWNTGIYCVRINSEEFKSVKFIKAD